ncbi:unnamed protein product, partial [Durusdinium trenchii]
VPEPSAERPKKALKTADLTISTIAAVKETTAADTAMKVHVHIVPFTESLFHMNIWCGDNGDRLRLPLQVKDSTGTLTITAWQDLLACFTDTNFDDLATMWTKCDNDEAAQTAFLETLNQKNTADTTWEATIRPRTWKSDVQWTVVDLVALAK